MNILKSFLGRDKTNQVIRLNQKVVQLTQQGQYEQAIPMANRACELARKYLGEEAPDYAKSLGNLGELYFLLGNHAEAEQLFQQAIVLVSKALGEQDPYVAIGCNNLAALYRTMGRYTEAEALYLQVLEIFRQNFGQEHEKVATVLNNIALLYQLMGRYKQAESLHRQALEICRRTLGEEHPNFGTCLNTLARLYQLKGQYAEAENLFQQALDIRRTSLGENHPSVAISLTNLAGVYQVMAHYTEAEALLQQALGIYRQNFGENHPDIALGLHNLSILYVNIGNYPVAEEYLQQMVKVYRQNFGENHPIFATALSNLATLHTKMGKYSTVKPLFEQVLEIQRRTLGDNHPELANTLSHLATFYQDIGNYNAAEPLFRQALLIRRQNFGENHLQVAESLTNLGGLSQLQGQYTDAELLVMQAGDTIKELLGEEHPQFALSLHNRAVMYREMGNSSSAESLFKQAIEIERQILGEHHPDLATDLDNLSGLYCLMGKYSAAEPLLRQALEIKRRSLGENHPDIAMSLNTLANLYFAMGSYKTAETQLLQAKEIVNQAMEDNKHPNFATIMSALGMVYIELSKYDEAESLIKQALELQRETLGENHPNLATTLNNLAGLYHITGEFAYIEPLLQKARDILRETFGEEHPYFTSVQNALGVLYWAMGDYTTAEPLLQRCLLVQRRVLGESHPAVVKSLENLALVFAATDRPAEALAMEEQAASMTEKLIEQVFSIGSESQRMAYLNTIQLTFYTFLSLVLWKFPHSSPEVRTGLNLVWRRKAIGAEALAAQRDAVLGGRYPHLSPKLEELTTLRMQIAQKTLAGPPSMEGLQAYKQLLTELDARKERLEAELARQIPEMNLQQKLQAANRIAVAQALPKGSVLVEFVRMQIFDYKSVPGRGEQQWKAVHYLAFIMLAGEADNVSMFDLGKAEPIEQMIAKFRASITGETERREFGTVPMKLITGIANVGIELRKAIFDPLLAVISDRKRLFIAPDGDLTKLPFEVLPTDDNRRLIDDYQISYLSTGRDVLRFDYQSSGKPTNPIVAADPDFDLSSTGVTATEETTSLLGRQSRDLDSRELNFKRLTYTETEGKHIAAQLGVKPLLGGEVLESQLKAIRSPRILHIATHGFFLPNQKQSPNTENLALMGDQMGRLSGQGLENPLLRSGLALAGANTWLKKGSLPPEAEDGILTAEDVSGLDLLDTELVVLSACETGLGEVQTGEGVFGLRRAFVLAGAKTLVMSLWKVPDQQTQELMTDYYDRILAGEPRGEALRSAQLEMKKKHPNPYYWGAFICQGNPYPLV